MLHSARILISNDYPPMLTQPNEDHGWLRKLVPRCAGPQHLVVAGVPAARMDPVRLFVALTPPGEIVEELRASTAALRELAPQLRWTRPEQWHITLVFLGEVTDDALAELVRRLSRAAARHPPLSLTLGGGDRFGHHVLWTQVQGDRDGLRRLADSVQAAARRSRLPVEQRPYRPHLTLARADVGFDLRPLVERLAAWQGQPWVARRLYLVRSRLGAGSDGSALHEPIANWSLKG